MIELMVARMLTLHTASSELVKWFIAKTVSKKDNQILWKIMCCQEFKINHVIDGQSDSVSFHGL